MDLHRTPLSNEWDEIKVCIEDILQDLVCPICNRQYENPHTFTPPSCNHTFCYQCVVGTLEGKGVTKSVCPSCKQPVWKRDLKPARKLAHVIHSANNVSNAVLQMLQQQSVDDGGVAGMACLPASAPEHQLLTAAHAHGMQIDRHAYTPQFDPHTFLMSSPAAPAAAESKDMRAKLRALAEHWLSPSVLLDSIPTQLSDRQWGALLGGRLPVDSLIARQLHADTLLLEKLKAEVEVAWDATADHNGSPPGIDACLVDSKEDGDALGQPPSHMPIAAPRSPHRAAIGAGGSSLRGKVPHSDAGPSQNPAALSIFAPMHSADMGLMVGGRRSGRSVDAPPHRHSIPSGAVTTANMTPGVTPQGSPGGGGMELGEDHGASAQGHGGGLLGGPAPPGIHAAASGTADAATTACPHQPPPLPERAGLPALTTATAAAVQHALNMAAAVAATAPAPASSVCALQPSIHAQPQGQQGQQEQALAVKDEGGHPNQKTSPSPSPSPLPARARRPARRRHAAAAGAPSSPPLQPASASAPRALINPANSHSCHTLQAPVAGQAGVLRDSEGEPTEAETQPNKRRRGTAHAAPAPPHTSNHAPTIPATTAPSSPSPQPPTGADAPTPTASRRTRAATPEATPPHAPHAACMATSTGSVPYSLTCSAGTKGLSQTLRSRPPIRLSTSPAQLVRQLVGRVVEVVLQDGQGWVPCTVIKYDSRRRRHVLQPLSGVGNQGPPNLAPAPAPALTHLVNLDKLPWRLLEAAAEAEAALPRQQTPSPLPPRGVQAKRRAPHLPHPPLHPPQEGTGRQATQERQGRCTGGGLLGRFSALQGAQGALTGGRSHPASPQRGDHVHPAHCAAPASPVPALPLPSPSTPGGGLTVNALFFEEPSTAATRTKSPAAAPAAAAAAADSTAAADVPATTQPQGPSQAELYGRRQVVVVASSLPLSTRAALVTFVRKMGRPSRVEAEITSDATHCVVQCDEAGLATARTSKYLVAIMSGLKVVRHTWVLASIAAGHWVDEEQHWVHGDVKTLADFGGVGGPGRVRGVWLARGSEGVASLFTGVCAHVVEHTFIEEGAEGGGGGGGRKRRGRGGGTQPGRGTQGLSTEGLGGGGVVDTSKLRTLRRCLALGGARPIHRPPVPRSPSASTRPRRGGLGGDGGDVATQAGDEGSQGGVGGVVVITGKGVSEEEARGLKERWGVDPVTWTWVVESVACFERRPLALYHAAAAAAAAAAAEAAASRGNQHPGLAGGNAA